MNILKKEMIIGGALATVSALIYFVHFLVFKDAHHIYIYLLGDIAFLPLEVFLVSVILHKTLTIHEKKSRLNKMNMAIGVFFSEVGNKLLHIFSKQPVECYKELSKITPEIKSENLKNIIKLVNNIQLSNNYDAKFINEIKEYLIPKRHFMLQLLENPNLLEHESFTDLLWSVFHLLEELEFRKVEISELPQDDLEHLSGDINRAISQLSLQWAKYVEHLKAEYPYLFSLSARNNPFRT